MGKHPLRAAGLGTSCNPAGSSRKKKRIHISAYPPSVTALQPTPPAHPAAHVPSVNSASVQPCWAPSRATCRQRQQQQQPGSRSPSRHVLLTAQQPAGGHWPVQTWSKHPPPAGHQPRPPTHTCRTSSCVMYARWRGEGGCANVQ